MRTDALNRSSGASICELSVIIPVFNGERTLQTCLEALFKSLEVSFEVIVVNDASTDVSVEIASRFPVKLISLHRRVGGGLARNEGAKEAKAPVFVFTDADVEVGPTTLDSIRKAFSDRPDLPALFGAYHPDCPHENFFSQYKNLHHHYIHSRSRREALTFWSGLGAVRRECFQAVGGFAELKHSYDVDLGYRLNRAGYGIELKPDIQAKHHKRYTFLSLLHSDFLERAVPWVRVMWRHRIISNDLNTRLSHVLSVLVLFLSLFWLLIPLSGPARASGPVIGFGVIGLLNRDWGSFCVGKRGWAFAMKAMAMEWVYYFYSGLGALAGTLAYGFDLIFRKNSSPANDKSSDKRDASDRANFEG